MTLNTLDLVVIILFFLSMVVIGILSYFKSKDAEDYFVAGGSLPWWLAGISHHVSGHSGAEFVAYAAVAYTHGFTTFVGWAFPGGVAVIGTAKISPAYCFCSGREVPIHSHPDSISIAT